MATDSKFLFSISLKKFLTRRLKKYGNSKKNSLSLESNSNSFPEFLATICTVWRQRLILEEIL